MSPSPNWEGCSPNTFRKWTPTSSVRSIQPRRRATNERAMSKAGRRAVYFLNGPNANLYGLTDTGTYGADTFETLESRCANEAKRLLLVLDFRQSNSEG